MIEELKFLLDKMEGIPDLGLWVLGGFAAYKLIIYMSTTGAFVYIAQLLITKIHDAITKPKKVNFEGLFFDDADISPIRQIMAQYTTTMYVHGRDAKRIYKALEDGLKKDLKE